MSRIPPNLLYLTIYNPTLRPASPVPDDDEDAEEQAHILFYTSKERAVSRDRMLRQVGLAKALVSFSSMFNGADPCNSIHSQSKRMIMVSPEPDFWIHAAVEVAKVPRVPPEKSKEKSKVKPKPNEKGKDKERESEPQPMFDYQEGSVHDLALRADIIRGYEQFKLTHGSFTSILATLGQEGLELQLERFFTVWAWSWNLEDGAEFRDHLGIPLHPSFRTLSPVLDSYSQHLPKHTSCIFIQPPYVVPSSQYSASKHPTALSRHLFSAIPPTPPPSQDLSHDGTIRGKQHTNPDAPNGKDPPKGAQVPSGSTFLGMPTMKMNVNMGVSKWSWPGYLTFGKGAGKRPALEETQESKKAAATADDGAQVTATQPARAMGLDQSALEDAISDNASISPSSTAHSDLEESRAPPNGTDIDPCTHTQSADMTEQPQAALDSVRFQVSHRHDPAKTDADSASLTSSASTISTTEFSIPPPLRLEFSFFNVHLADEANPPLTTRQRVYYIVHDRSMLALVGLDEHLATFAPELPQGALTLLDEIDTLLTAELSKTITANQLPTASKILQPIDTHIMSAGQFAVSSPDFSSKSGYLFDAQELQAMDPDISEVFSRGLNPQHWHIARRGLGMNLDEQGAVDEGEVYMEVFRKEASLSDVDNVLAGVVRRCGLVDSSV